MKKDSLRQYSMCAKLIDQYRSPNEEDWLKKHISKESIRLIISELKRVPKK